MSMPADCKQYVNPWTQERVEQLKTMWAAGLSAAQCAAKLGEGLTRNSIIGKVNRIGLVGRQAKTRATQIASRHPKRVAPLKAPKPAAPTAEEILATSLPPDQSPCAVTLMQLTDTTCRWPIDAPDGPLMYCGAKPTEDSPYCPRHGRLAYNKTDRRQAVGFTGSWRAA